MRRADSASHRACRLISFLNDFVSEENKGDDAQLFLRDCFVFNSRKWASCPASFATLSDAESFFRERGTKADGPEKRKNFGNISCFRKDFKKFKILRLGLTLAGRLTGELSPLILLEMAERGQAQKR